MKSLVFFVVGVLASLGNAQVIMKLEKGLEHPLLDSSKAFWILKNDKTERPGVGETESEVIIEKDKVFMRGLLASLPSNGPHRVGFSLIETAITQSLQRSEGIVFEMSGTEKLWVSVLVKDRQAHTAQGTLTFQWDFEVTEETQKFVAFWKDFVPTIRGKKVSGYELDLFSITHLSFQVSRSKQQKWQNEVPLPFEVEL